MAVYVDDAQIPYRRMKMCHMVADTVEELHAMAGKIGIRRIHYQGPPKTINPHYDICLQKRKLAIENGALEVTTKQCVKILKEMRQQVIDDYIAQRDKNGDD